MSDKFKSFLADDAIFYSLLLILVAVASFGLGRQASFGEAQSATVSTQNAVEILTPQAASTPIEPKEGSAIAVVASKSGTKYHLPTCPGAKQIKEENKIYFGSVAEAEAAGYTPAANCKF